MSAKQLPRVSEKGHQSTEIVNSTLKGVEQHVEATAKFQRKPHNKYAKTENTAAIEGNPHGMLEIVGFFLVLFILLGVGSYFEEADFKAAQASMFVRNNITAPVFEKQLGTAENLEAVFPENNFNLKLYTTFKWKGNNTEASQVNIYNHNGRKVWSKTVANSRFKFDNRYEKLTPGQYYWQIESNGDILHTGKFFVNKPHRAS